METESKPRPEFDEYAAAYAQLLADPARNRFARDPLHFHRRKQLLIRRLLRRAGIDPSTLQWLDVGCGRGELLELAGRSFAHAAGCDPSAAMLPRQAWFEVRRQPAPTELPFADASVDFVTAVCVYHHVHGAARMALAREMNRVLTAGGICCIIEHNPWNPVTRAIVKRCPVDADAELLGAAEVRRILAASGFQSMTTDYFLYLPERLFARFGWAERLWSGLPFGGQFAVLAQAKK